MKAPKEIFEEYSMRRKAIIRALTQDVEKFYIECDPEKDNLCLYGYPDGNWAVDLPADEVPPEVPEPALGINFARDGMRRTEWLALVAVHSDSWLLALAFYRGARLDKEQRDELFSMINSLPTCYEVVSGRARGAAVANNKKRPFPSNTTSSRPTMQRQQRPKHQDEDFDDDEDEDDDQPPPEKDDAWNDGDGEPCPTCGRLYRTEDFWIACDTCDVWYCGRCAKMTQAKAEKIKNWRCNKCI